MARSTVTRAKDGPLAAAVTEDGRIDLSHPHTIKWIAERDGTDKEDTPASGDQAIPLEELERLTLQQITERFGHIEQFYLHVRARKEFEQAARAQIQRDRLERRLIPVSIVEEALAAINAGHSQLLVDVSQSLPKRLRGVAAYEDQVRLTRELIGASIATTKRLVSRRLRAVDPTAPLKEPSPSKPRKIELEAASRGVRIARESVTELANVMAETLSKQHSPRDRDDVARYLRRVLDERFSAIARDLPTSEEFRSHDDE